MRKKTNKTSHTPAKATRRPRRTLRLPSHVAPRTIDLHLNLDPAPKTRAFSGHAGYALDLKRASSTIELHSAELRVSNVFCEITHDGTTMRIDAAVEAHPECETIVLRFAQRLPAGQIRLSLDFRGQVRSDLRGLYRGSDPETPWLASQLCPTDARRLFPCFDEPGTKARYRISIKAPADQFVLANSPVEHTSRAIDGFRITTFAETPPLSVYLIAVAVGPFEVSRIAHAGKTPIRVITLPGKRALGRFAREAAVESLVRLEKWFGMAHPYEKLDLVALPDFAFGAMENAGAVFFRDSVLLLDEREATLDDRTRASETIAHELAHMWFGNLVTMAWWNDLWLNESFATWMAYEIVQDWQPDWPMWQEFVARREGALELDALANSHPIAPPVKTADEAQENFDAITYTKGASVLRMLERYLGPRVFRDGVRRYIRAHRESAATAADLWASLEEASGLEIEKIVAPWTARTGFPIVTATQTTPAKGAASKVKLAQSRFTLGASPRKKDPAWTIPWLARNGRGRRANEIRHVLTKQRESLPQETTKSSPRWLYANGDEAGFFRIDHGAKGHARLLENIDALKPIERMGWVGHQWALVRARKAPIGSLLDLLGALANESDPEVLRAIERVLSQLVHRLAPDCGSATRERLQAWITVQYGGQLRELGLRPTRGESGAVTQRRARILSIVGHAGGSARLAEACRELAVDHLEGGRALPRGAEEIVLSLGARTGDRALQKALIDAVRRAETPQARRRPLFALTSYGSGAGLNRTLRVTLDRKIAPAVDRATLLMLLLSGHETAPPTWEHLQANWNRLAREMPPILLARLAGETSRALPITESKRIRAFFEAHPLAAGGRVLRQVSEELTIAGRVARHARADLKAYLGG